MSGTADAFGGLGFLVGRWRGEGTVRGRPVTSRTECRPSESSPDSLSLLVRTWRDGALIHEEDVVLMAATGHAVRCITRPRTDAEQVWRVVRTGDGAWEITRPGHAWTIVRTADGYEETFDAADAHGTMGRVVALRHVRDEEVSA